MDMQFQDKKIVMMETKLVMMDVLVIVKSNQDGLALVFLLHLVQEMVVIMVDQFVEMGLLIMVKVVMIQIEEIMTDVHHLVKKKMDILVQDNPQHVLNKIMVLPIKE